MANQSNEDSELDAKEVLSYYDEFYTSGDFKYYPEKLTKRFFNGIFAKCGVNAPYSGRILDVGCGTGFYCKIFHEMGFHPVGIDFSSTAIEKAREKHPHLEFHVADALNLPFEPGSFNFILSYGCSVVSTHDLTKIHDYIRHLMGFIKPGGWLLIIGGSNLTGRRLETSSWLSHTWGDLLQLVPKGEWRVLGPYLSHVRLVSFLGRHGLIPAITSILRIPGPRFVKGTFHFVQKL
jgi:SAM-dependent methyltransferase